VGPFPGASYRMRFYVNVDHVATVREARKTDEPDPCEAALECEAGGADGITVHLREDRRHIQDSDVRKIAGAIAGPINLELATAPQIIDFCLEMKPLQATLVPENREEVTTEGGIDLVGSDSTRLVSAFEQMRDAGINVSLFIDPDEAVVRKAAEIGVPAIELHTGDYANSGHTDGAPIRRLQDAATLARELGLAVHAGHGLTYRNVGPVAAIGEIEELNIGHSIVSRAVYVGMRQAVSEMKSLIDQAR
jgi:pyridoxine 5-phosphate synthase